MPNRKPKAAGKTDPKAPPIREHCEEASISIAGINSDQIDAATITPDAKPSSDFCSRIDIPSFIIKTKAEPSIVPSNGMNRPIAIVSINAKEQGLLVSLYLICKFYLQI